MSRGDTKWGCLGSTALGELEVDMDVLVAEFPARFEEGEALGDADLVVRAQTLHVGRREVGLRVGRTRIERDVVLILGVRVAERVGGWRFGRGETSLGLQAEEAIFQDACELLVVGFVVDGGHAGIGLALRGLDRLLGFLESVLFDLLHGDLHVGLGSQHGETLALSRRLVGFAVAGQVVVNLPRGDEVDEHRYSDRHEDDQGTGEAEGVNPRLGQVGFPWNVVTRALGLERQ